MPFGGDWIAGQGGRPEVKTGHFGLSQIRAQLSSVPLIYDLASLTKVIVTSTLLVTEAKAQKLQEFSQSPLVLELPELRGTVLEHLSVKSCWEHRSGLRPFRDFANPPRLAFASRSQAWDLILKTLAQENLGPPEDLYSDLGFLLLGIFLERRHKKNLSEIWETWKVDHGLPKDDLFFLPSQKYLPRVVPTESRHPTGEVNDDRAAFLGGIAPHSGLFGTANGVWLWLEKIHLLAKTHQAFRTWTSPQAIDPQVPSQRFYFGWDRPQDPLLSHAGAKFSGFTLGHLGYTGTALFFDAQSQRGGVFLSNRVCPADSVESRHQIKELRRRFFDGIWENKLGEIWEKIRL